MPTKPSQPGTTHPGNNFDAIRVVAALMVLYSHHYALTGQAEPTFFGLTTLGALAVNIFFVISGYLVTASWQRDPSVWRFALRRFLRIWPALTAVILLAAYGLGPWVTKLPLKDYLSHPMTADYLRGLWMQIRFMLPGVFEDNPYRLSVNGSLWTIPIEVNCYIVLGLAGAIGLLRYRAVFLLGAVVCMAWFLVRKGADLTGQVEMPWELGAFFLTGAVLYTLQPQWNRHPARWAAIFGLAAALAWIAGWRHTALLIGLPFAVICAATQATPVIHRAGRWGDLSYGIYLFAFPVQQTVILYLWPQAGFAGTLAVALLVTGTLAYASWHLIEKQALKFKPSSRASDSGLGLLRHAFTQHGGAKGAGWFWPLLACIVGLRFAMKHLGAPPLIDPAVTYLPAAQAFLEQGWSFLLTPQSYRVTPLAYLWPALWGADPTAIRIANMALWVGCVGFLWRTCCLLGGVRAGAVAMLLLISTGELMRYFPTEMTEPLYLFGIFGWMHAMARIIIGREYSVAVVVQGALMLAIALLSRPVLQLVAPVALLACLAWMAYGSAFKKEALATERSPRLPVIAWSLGLALILPLALILKNGLVFGLWGMGTGAGTGLYLGTHPLFQGAEPGFLGFGYDVNLLAGLKAGDGDHLSLAADRVLRNAGLWQMQTMSMQEALTFFGRKLWWWLAHHPAAIEANGSALRKLRFFELLIVVTSMAWLALDWRRRRASRPRPGSFPVRPTGPQLAFGAFLLAMFLVLLVQLLPILYNGRYSSVLLDPWLIPLAAWGIAGMTAAIRLHGTFGRQGWSIGMASAPEAALWPALGTLAAVLAATFVGYGLSRQFESVAVDPRYMGPMVTHLDITAGDRIGVQGMRPQGDRTWVTTESPAVLQVRIDAGDVERIAAAKILTALWKTDLALLTSGQRCRKAEFAYQTTDGRILQPAYKLPLLLPLRADGAFHPLVTHAHGEMTPLEPGSLRIVLHCPAGTVVQWRDTQFLESRHVWDVAAHIQP